MSRLIKSLVIVSACSLLAACAHPDLLEVGQSGDFVVTELGAPDSKMTLADGGYILVYSHQPFGMEVYWLYFDKDGRFVKHERALNEEHFALVQVGKHTKADVYQMFGKCAQEYDFRLQKETAFMYRFEDVGGYNQAFWVQFDTQGIVTETAVTQDPWENDGFWQIGL